MRRHPASAFIISVLLTLLVLCLAAFSATATLPAHRYAEAAYHNLLPVQRLPPNEVEIHRRDYRRVIGEVGIYSMPDSARLQTRPASDFWVSVRSTVEGWAEINAGEWVRWEHLERAPVSRFSGVILPRRTKYPLGFLPRITFSSPQPGVEPVHHPDAALDRYTLVTLFDQVIINGETWVQLGAAMWVRGAEVARITPLPRPAAVISQRWVGVDLAQQVLIAYDGTRPVFATLISSGFPALPTQPGVFTVYHRQPAQTMGWGTPGEPFAYTVEDVPYVLFFNGDQALHGAYWHDEFGTARSHGCVNLSPSDARWVYDFLSAEINFADLSDPWPMVVVY